MSENTKIDKVSKLLDLLDKHLKEENCIHDPKDLFEEYESMNS